VASVVRGFCPLLRFSRRGPASPIGRATKGKVESGGEVRQAQRAGGQALSPRGRKLKWLARALERRGSPTLRIHGTTHERPIDRFAREQLTPLGSRPPYRYERVRLRRVANDALVAIGAARYSVPVEYVGLIVSVHESTGHLRDLPPGIGSSYAIRRAARHSVLMEPAHYAGTAARRPAQRTAGAAAFRSELRALSAKS